MSRKRGQTIRKTSADIEGLGNPQHLIVPHRLARSHSQSLRVKSDASQASLTDFEKTEVQKYPHVYFYGNIEAKLAVTEVTQFDDREKHYRANVGDHIAYRFEILEIIGRGVFGEVLRCFDHKRQREVALKILANTRDMKEQGVLEAEVVRKLTKDSDDRGGEFVAKSRGSFLFREHICIEFELLGMNLHEYRQMKGSLPIPMHQIRRIARDVLSGLAFCHRHRVVHCDLKPENIAFTRHGFDRVKIIDFGSTCYIGLQKYGYVQSRFYRAPEVMIGAAYGAPIDIWSFGCILAELATGRPLFSGRSEEEQMVRMLSVLGVPSKGVIEQGSRWSKFFDKDGNPLDAKVVRNVPTVNSLEMVTQITDLVFLDLVAKCLVWDPAERITAESGLRHPFFSHCDSPGAKKLEMPDAEWR